MPPANLDAHGSLQLTKMLAKLKAGGYTIVISEHRLSYLKDVADRMIVMSGGEIVKGFDRQRLLALLFARRRNELIDLRKFVVKSAAEIYAK